MVYAGCFISLAVDMIKSPDVGLVVISLWPFTYDLNDLVGTYNGTMWLRSLLCDLNQLLRGDTSGGVKVDMDAGFADIFLVFLSLKIGDNHGACEVIVSQIFDMLHDLWGDLEKWYINANFIKCYLNIYKNYVVIY